MEHIKNSVLITIDSSNPTANVTIGKMGMMPPSTSNEMDKIIMLDMFTICEGLIALIKSAHQYGTKNQIDSMRDCIKRIEDAFIDPKIKEEINRLISAN